MIEWILLLPSVLRSNESSEFHGKCTRDLFLLCIVMVMNCCNIQAPKRIFVALLVFGIVCQIINDLSYKILPPKLKLREQWKALQKRQTNALLLKYVAAASAASENTSHRFLYDTVSSLSEQHHESEAKSPQDYN